MRKILKLLGNISYHPNLKDLFEREAKCAFFHCENEQVLVKRSSEKTPNIWIPSHSKAEDRLKIKEITSVSYINKTGG